jgi:hypothetical protein
MSHYKTVRCHNPEDHDTNLKWRNNLRCYNRNVFVWSGGFSVFWRDLCPRTVRIEGLTAVTCSDDNIYDTWQLLGFGTLCISSSVPRRSSVSESVSVFFLMLKSVGTLVYFFLLQRASLNQILKWSFDQVRFSMCLSTVSHDNRNMQLPKRRLLSWSTRR